MALSQQTPFQILLEIDRRYRDLIGSSVSAGSVARTWSGIGFRLGTRYFVSPLGEIDEVIHEPPLTLLPGVKPWVRGVANVRGRLLPVFDFAGFLGVEAVGLPASRRVLLVAQNDIFIGLIVDEVFGMQHFPASSYVRQSPTDQQDIQPFIEGYFQRDHPWLVFRPFALARHQRFHAVALENNA